MRAERLVSLIILLQAKRQISVAEMAEQLEVSSRTIQRDLEALELAGIPLVSERGRGGGWSLVEGYRNQLAQLKANEVQAISLAPHKILRDLGLEDAAESASLKLLASLPDFRRAELDLMRERLYIDSAPWQSQDEDLHALPVLQEAIWQERRATIHYEKGEHELAERLIEPLGLVAKGRIWYCVAWVDEAPRNYRVSRIQKIELGDYFSRPDNFDLADYWQASSRDFVANLPVYPAKLRIHRENLRFLQAWRWARIVQIEEVDADWRVVTVNFEEIEEASAAILACGASTEVIDPEALRQRVQEKREEFNQYLP